MAQRTLLRNRIPRPTADWQRRVFIAFTLVCWLFLAGVISLLDPAYMRPLFQSGGGQVALAIAGVMVIMGSLAIKRIVEIKV